jgi:hypothetical protein
VEVVVAATTPVFHLQTVAACTGTGTVVRSIGPTFSGTPLAPTAAIGTNTTQIATTAYADRIGVQQVARSVTGAVSTGTTTIPVDDTIPQNTEGTEFMSVSITPKSSASTLAITVTFCCANSAADLVTAALFQDSTADALGAASVYIPLANMNTQITFRFFKTSATTSATTFKVRAGPSTTGTMTFNGSAGGRLFGGVFSSSIVIEEIGA